MTPLKTAQRLHNSQPIPTNAVIYKRNGREFYVSGLSMSNVRIRYLDNMEFESLSWNEGSMYKPFCVEPIKK